MSKVLLTISAALIALSAMSGISHAQTVCGERSKFVNKLKDSYSEKQISLGLASNGSMIEIFASDNGTFSIVITQPGGPSCLVAAGNSWQSAPLQKAEAKI
jgi:hypothetical protein